MRENDFYIFVPLPSDLDLDLWPLDLKFAPLATLFERYVSTELEVSTAFLFRENRRYETDGLTDGVQHLMQLPRESRVTNISDDIMNQNLFKFFE